MTTKPKALKVPVKAAVPKAAPKTPPTEPQRDVSRIATLVSRWDWLEADQNYQAEIAATEKEAERLAAIHNAEQMEIERELSTLAPKSFHDVFCLLKFARMIVDDGGTVDSSDSEIIKNVLEALPFILRERLDAERKKIRKDIISRASRGMELALDMDDMLNRAGNKRAVA
jgi:hypothetical protein